MIIKAPKRPYLLLFLFLGLAGCNTSTSSTSTTTDTTEAVATNTQGQASGNEVVLSEQALANARTNYTTYCAGCHGSELETFINRDWKYGTAHTAMFTSIKEGHPTTGMPGFANTLSDEEINNLATFIRQGIVNKQAQNTSEGTGNDMAGVIRSEEVSFRLDTIVTGIEVPWGMAFLPNGDMLVTERSGTLYRLTNDRQLQKIEGAPEVLAEGQGGLLDVELHPDFRNNNVIFLSYSAVKREGGETLSTTAIMRAQLDGNALKNKKVIFEGQPWTKTRHHYGSRIEFGPDGNLYFTMGDRGGTFENPQDLSRHAGKTHRIKEDGSIPQDNPFVNKQGALPSIYTYGNRNPQGLALNTSTKEMWAHEHGPKGGDEVNILEKGANYGWPVVTYGIDYNGSIISNEQRKEGIKDPIHYWVPSIAPSGMAFVTGNRYKGWEGDLLSGSMSFKFLSRAKVEGNQIVGEERLLKDIGRVRDVKMSPDGYVYIAVERPGAIFRLVPVDTQ
ncbi:PQQ-dependent sugar dehydrogenase [Pontibacter toksunensis]|uniref:PQQ-dependent sugar dehydrogenase n=1 Tax=Pontibacter toksunensis TaxID=1332631 RepID=A0ABW6BVG3_9BACT